MSNGNISLYKRVDAKMLKESGFEILKKEISYLNNEELLVTIDDDASFEKGELILQDTLENWGPDTYDLYFMLKLKLSNIKALFGKNGVTNVDNKLGIVAYIYSKGSGFQDIKKVCTISYNETENEYDFEYCFKKGTLRGMVNIELYFYLDTLNTSNIKHTTIVGAKLSDPIIKLKLIVDGQGSMFPIIEANKPGEPLWNLVIKWADPTTEYLDEDSLYVELNQAHPRFKNIINQKTENDKFWMQQIIIQSIAMIIQQAVFIDKLSKKDFENSEEGTIANTINYWLSNFNIDLREDDITSILFSINQQYEKIE